MSNDSSAIVHKVPPPPRLRRAGWNYPPSLFELWRDTENLPPPAKLAAKIVERLKVALEEFRGVEESVTKEDVR